ncbi:MAG TPA: hypothetical protein VFO75_03900 [Candidatus Dormibacteraeota bacterium]|nr:hypothetical protein [Candidatus Dormibacteraeota bacterium]
MRTAYEYAPPQPLVLLVGRDPVEQLRIRVTLEREGFCVLRTTVDELSSVLRIVTPALILVDVEAASDPLALVRSVRRGASGETRVVAMTGDPTVGSTLMESRRHCTGVVAKPLDLRSLGRRMAELVG